VAGGGGAETGGGGAERRGKGHGVATGSDPCPNFPTYCIKVDRVVQKWVEATRHDVGPGELLENTVRRVVRRHGRILLGAERLFSVQAGVGLEHGIHDAEGQNGVKTVHDTAGPGRAAQVEARVGEAQPVRFAKLVGHYFHRQRRGEVAARRLAHQGHRRRLGMVVGE
jgi:hypothetical protein